MSIHSWPQVRYNLLMTFWELLASFLAQQDQPGAPGASDHDLSHLEATLDVELPHDVREVYRQTDGLTLSWFLNLLPITRSLEFAQAMTTFEVPGPWGLVPLFDDARSNPLCVATRAPLTGFLVRIPHDDVKHLAHRDAVSLLRVLIEAPNFGDNEPPSPFVSSHRTVADAETARALIAQADTLGELSRRDGLRFAFTLLGVQGVDAIASFLDDVDDDVRESARARLKELAPHAENAVLALQHAHDEREVFARACVRLLNAAGLKATFERKSWGPDVRVEPGPFGLNLDMFWSWRTQPDFPERFTTRVRELQALQTKRSSS